MKFEDFDLDLTKITKGYGVNPLDDGVAPDTGPGYTRYSCTCADNASCGFLCWLDSRLKDC